MSIEHHAIVVTSSSPTAFNTIEDKARVLFADECPPEWTCNQSGYSTLFIGPDGSEDGTPESLEGDRRRGEFIDWLTANREALKNPDWFEVGYGGDSNHAAVYRSPWPREGE